MPLPLPRLAPSTTTNNVFPSERREQWRCEESPSSFFVWRGASERLMLFLPFTFSHSWVPRGKE